jgi:hypothetical protein
VFLDIFVDFDFDFDFDFGQLFDSWMQMTWGAEPLSSFSVGAADSQILIRIPDSRMSLYRTQLAGQGSTPGRLNFANAGTKRTRFQFSAAFDPNPFNKSLSPSPQLGTLIRYFTMNEIDAAGAFTTFLYPDDAAIIKKCCTSSLAATIIDFL